MLWNAKEWQEWRLCEAEVLNARFAVVAASVAPFKSSDAAIEWAVAHGIVGMMSEMETGGKGRVGISKNSIREMLNPSQVGKSASREVHYAALTVLRELIRESVIVESHFDRRKGPDMRRSLAHGVNKDVLIDVAYAALAIGTELYRAKITFKRYKDSNVAGKAYAYHLTKIEVLTGNLVNAVEGTYPKANTPITNQEKASLVLMPSILLNGVVDVNGVPFVKEGT